MLKPGYENILLLTQQQKVNKTRLVSMTSKCFIHYFLCSLICLTVCHKLQQEQHCRLSGLWKWVDNKKGIQAAMNTLLSQYRAICPSVYVSSVLE